MRGDIFKQIYQNAITFQNINMENGYAIIFEFTDRDIMINGVMKDVDKDWPEIYAKFKELINMMHQPRSQP